MIKWILFRKHKAGSKLKNRCNSPYQQTNGQKTMFTTDAKKKKSSFYKMFIHGLKKQKQKLSNLDIEGDFIILIKGMYKKYS